MPCQLATAAAGRQLDAVENSQRAGKRLANPLEVFAARCQARAQLWCAGEFELRDAVDALQAAAIKLGLIQKLGQDAVQRIMAEPFTANPSLFDAELSAAFVAEIERVCDEVNRRPPSIAPISTLHAAEYLAQQNDPQRMRAWLEDRSADQRTAIRRHLEAKRCRSRESK